MQEKDNINTEFSNRILQLIEYHGISKNAFALKIGYKRAQTLYDLFRGKSKPSFDFFQKLASSEYTESLEWLLTGSGNMLKEPVIRKEKNISNGDGSIVGNNSNITHQVKTNNDEIHDLQSELKDVRHRVEVLELELKSANLEIRLIKAEK